ncbi:hypothetical protein AB4Z52_14190 [Rhizobium sp. 2YAF20]|uniref:hypothetical protein n=1 Tax=Rhizobium sp. 2YAF20 TaxID=3233027 RepID=UPI003F9D93F2
MKVHRALQSYYNTPLSKTDTGSNDDSTPFTLPDDEASQKATPPTVASTSIPSSISSGFWLNQSRGNAATSATDATTASSDTSAAANSSEDLLAEFAKLASMTPAEKIRAEYLSAHNMSEEQFSQLSSDDQKAINDEIAAQIKQKLGADGKPKDD